MTRQPKIEKALFDVKNQLDFNAVALEIFHFQYAENKVYRSFVDFLKRKPEDVQEIAQIPFLPIEIFKTHQVIASDHKTLPQLVFSSSGTTGAQVSKHFVAFPDVYEQSFLKGFAHFYGNPEDYRILALLPSYLERGGSSLVYMADRLIRESGHPDSGFFLDNKTELRKILTNPTQQKTLLIGVSYALLDLASDGELRLENTIVMETGGMKGRRKEMTRTELHSVLKDGLGISEIHSEYGMTELLSQAYAKKHGHFACPPWMRLAVRDANDPLSPAIAGRSGGINVTDLANLYSCSFIATSDLGRALPNGTHEILGRFDYSDMRGCNLMVGMM